MVDPRGEVDLWWLEWVIRWEMDVQEEDTASIWGIVWSHDSGLPVILVLLVDWTCGAVSGWILTEVNELFLNSLDCRHQIVFNY